jgi:hypothetical protein
VTDPSAHAPGTDSLSVAALSFDADLAEVMTCDDATRWSILRVDTALAVWVIMSPMNHAEERFHALIRWETYQEHAPSVRFGDPATGRLDVTSAWPTGGPFRPTSFSMCVSYTAEGFAMHPEWVRDPQRRWDAHGNGLLKVIRCLQEDLDVHFAGRHP